MQVSIPHLGAPKERVHMIVRYCVVSAYSVDTQSFNIDELKTWHT